MFINRYYLKKDEIDSASNLFLFYVVSILLLPTNVNTEIAHLNKKDGKEIVLLLRIIWISLIFYVQNKKVFAVIIICNDLIADNFTGPPSTL